MFESHLGEFAALGTAIFWTITATSFEAAGKRVGSLAVNMLRLFLGLAFLSIFTWFTRGLLLPTDASAHTWLWLGISGVIGFSIGDLLLFKAFVVIGSRISMLIMATVPPLSALIGWLMMGETLTARDWVGMTLTIGGIALVVLERKADENHVSFSRPLKGILFAFGGALGQAIGLVFSKYGMGEYSAFAATQIRIIAGIAGFAVLFVFLKRWGRVFKALYDGRAMAAISLGAFFGPFLGVSFSLLAVQYTSTGVAATIMSIVPVLIIPPAVLFFHEKVTLREVIGALLAVAGVGMLFL